MKLKVYIPENKDLPFDSVRLGYSSTANEQKVVKTPPFGRPVIIFFIRPNSVKNFGVSSDGVLLGQHTHPLMMDLDENYRVMAIHLKPYGLKQLFNIDASKLTNKFIGINGFEMLDGFYQSVRQCIDDDRKLIQTINSFFDSAKLHPVSHEVLRFLKHLQVNEPLEISKMAREIGFSERNLERRFKSEVGISPKKYIQIRRVFEVFETLKTNNDWQQLVFDYKYTDQPHLIKEFKRYANIAPGLYVRQGLTLVQQLPPAMSFGI